MTTATVRAVARQFIEAKTPEVLVLKGPWGVGKTHAWKILIEAFKNQSSLPSYSYVSLFGVGSIAELRLAIFAKTRSVKTVGEKLTAASVNENWLDYAKRVAKGVAHLGARAKDIPIIKNITVGFDAVAPHLISDTLVCLDDFERLSERLSAEELLGFISSLKEEKNCKVVLIFNEQRLKEKAEIYARYREKLVDIELLYLPSPAEAADIAFGKGMPWFQQVRERSIALGATNIRLLRKIERLASMIWPEISKLHPTVLRQAVDSIVLLSWCYYEPDDTKPTIDFLRRFDSLGYAFAKSRQKETGEKPDLKVESWERILDAYGFRRMDEFDLSLLKVVEQGYIEETGVGEQANKLDGFFKAADLEQSFTKAWSMFHDTFANNEKELITALRESFKKSVKHISPINVNGTVMLLRDLGRDDIANELIDYYVSERAGEAKLFDLENYTFAGDLTDKALRAKFSEKSKLDNPLPPLSQAAFRIAKGSWGGNDERALDAASEDDFYALFKQDHGNDISRIVKGSLRLGAMKEHQELGKRVRAALERIASESKVNAIRVGRYLKQGALE